MKIKQGFDLRDICGEKVIVAAGLQNIDFSQIISLNETAAYLWENLSPEGFTVEDMAALLTKEYEVSEEVALADCKSLAADWIAAGIVE